MKKILLKLFYSILFIPTVIFAQVSENFADGELSNMPKWEGEVQKFVVNSSLQLQLNAPAESGVSYISTVSTAIENAEWEFWLKMAFNPSSNNFAKVYLVSDQQNLSGSLNGYFVKIGGADDEISLFRQSGATEVKIIDGLNQKVNVDPVEVRIKVTRSSTGNWQLFVDSTGGINYVQEETDSTDVTFVRSAWFGVSCVYTATRSNSFYFDDILVVGEPYTDKTPPVLNNLKVLSDSSLLLSFSEDILPETLLPENFMLGNESAISARLNSQTSNEVEICFSGKFKNGISLSLSIYNLQDLAGNKIIPTNKSFLYFEPKPVAFRDIVINELMADPSPVVGLPDAEYIEIYNSSGNPVSLKNWKISDGTTDGLLKDYILLPGSYLIVCASASQEKFNMYGSVMGITAWPSLNNSGDEIKLISDEGLVIDNVKYTDEWYGQPQKTSGGWSLEQINPFTTCTGQINWNASVNDVGGTPGKTNSVFNTTPALTPFKVNNIEVVTEEQVRVTFNRPFDKASVTSEKFDFSGINIRNIIIDDNLLLVNIDLDGSLAPGQIYTVEIKNIQSCDAIPLTFFTVPFGLGRSPLPGELLITEVYADPDPSTGLPEGEFVEILNITNDVISLNNLSFSDSSIKAKLPGLQILPKSYLILCPKVYENEYQKYGETGGLTNWPSLNNSGERILLHDDERIIFSVDYKDQWHQDISKKSGGWSLEMIDINYPCVEENNWISSTHVSGGTPGKINSVSASKPDLTAPKLLKAFATDSVQVRLIFNEKLDNSIIAGRQFLITPDTEVKSALLQSPLNRTIILQLGNPLTQGVLYSVTASQLKDCSGNSIGNENTASFALPENGNNRDIVINEILFNPRSGGVKFVEIYNRSSKYINLKDWALSNSKYVEGKDIKIFSNEDFILRPSDFLVITTDIQMLKSAFPQFKEEKALQVSSLPSIPETSGSVVLLDEEKILIDQVDYHEDFHFQLLSDIEGVSLERISTEAASNDPHNWRSAASVSGYATPGYMNSQAERISISDEQVKVEPEVFSPEDELNSSALIIYNLEHPGVVANVRIFDSSGRLIKHVARNQTLSKEGFFRWDGLDDSQRKVRIGSYMVYFELFDLQGNTRVFKKRVVVGGRL